MSEIEYVDFGRVNSEEFLPVLNEPTLRKHLIDHNYFNAISVREWMHGKRKIESMTGCRIRAVLIDGVLAGWCGIQPDDDDFEVAIVISKKFWGHGISIFKTLMCWAKELGHREIQFHLLETRPIYKFLIRKAIKVRKTKLLDRSFTTYSVSVIDWHSSKLTKPVFEAMTELHSSIQ